MPQLHAARSPPQAVAWLLSVPGASRTVLDMRIPYSRASLQDVLGKSPEVYACPGGCCQAPLLSLAPAPLAPNSAGLPRTQGQPPWLSGPVPLLPLLPLPRRSVCCACPVASGLSVYPRPQRLRGTWHKPPTSTP